MSRAFGLGAAVLRMQLRNRKRDFTSSTATPSSGNDIGAKSSKKQAVRPKRSSLGSKSAGQKVEIVAPTGSKLPVLSALNELGSHASKNAKILLQYPNLVPARLLRRYKRFLADVVLLDGTSKNENIETVKEEDEAVVTVYCPNTGPMVGLLDGLPNARVQLSKSDDPKRKYAYTLEMIQIHNGERNVWVGVHSTSANRMVEQALASRWFTELGHYDSIRREVKFAKNSRVDFVLTTNAEDGSVAHEKYVEVKSVTLALEGSDGSSSRCAVFPDTVSTRAQKHVTELTELLSAKIKAKAEENKEKTVVTPKISGAIVFLVQRDDCDEFAPSTQHDKKFAELCAVASKRGIQLLGYSCSLEPDEINSSGAVSLIGSLPLQTVVE